MSDTVCGVDFGSFENGTTVRTPVSTIAGTRRAVSPTVYGRVQKVDPEWFARATSEEPLEPEIAIVDTHHHLWHRPGFRYLMEEFAADLDCGHRIEATVYAECESMYRADGPEHLRPVGETEFAVGMAAMSRSGGYGPTRVAAGIVGFADLTLGDRVTETLEAHIAAGGGRFRGIRQRGKWDPHPEIGTADADRPGLYRDPVFQEGVRTLTRFGLAFDASIFHHQVSDVTALAEAVPEANIVLIHFGSPLGYGPYSGRHDEILWQWRADMADLAKRPNVTVKLGGIMIQHAGYDYGREPAPASSERLAELWRPYIETCIEHFGAGRCMVESNYPVERIGVTYGAIWNAFKRVTATASPAEKTAIYSGTAKRVYRLN